MLYIKVINFSKQFAYQKLYKNNYLQEWSFVA